MSEGYERNDLKTDMVFHKDTAMQRGTAGKGSRKKTGEYRARGHRDREYRAGKYRKRKHRLWCILISAGVILGTALLFPRMKGKTAGSFSEKMCFRDYGVVEQPAWEEMYLTPNPYSRPGDRLDEVNSIFVHYTANIYTSAAQNRSYFESLKDTGERSASAHFIIGYDGEIIQCIPLDEIAYAVKTRNYDSISIECCYKNEDGSFTGETYDSLIKLLAYLLKEYHLSTEDILRHYDCGGKKCPLYYVEHEEDWEQLKRDVEKLLK
ncbi:MAG: N-acetylmuramoyl-L-alanine amidase family protein [Lachnospiraceae bacterium]